MFEASLDHEKYMTTNINALADLCIEEKDHATNNLMQWYVSEQVEEEAQVEDIVKKLQDDGRRRAGPVPDGPRAEGASRSPRP